MIEINWTLFVQLLNFLVLVFLMNMVLFKPIRKILLDRKARYESFQDDIAGLAGNREGLLEKVDEELTQARREGLGLREGLRQEGSQAEGSLLEQVKKEVEAEWTKVEAKIKKDVAKAREALGAQAQDFAMALATKILGRKLS
jgi:F-type H+-transporting ATPase subunit b